MTQDKNKDQTQLWGRMFDAVKTYSSGSTREVSEITEAVTAVARSGCSCDGDPIECNHEAAAGWYEEKARQARAQVVYELRQRAIAVQVGTDPVMNRMYDCLVNGASTRVMACEAYRVIADMIENGSAPSKEEAPYKQFEIWEFSDGTVGRFSWAKDPDGKLALAACSETSPRRQIWASWRDYNGRTPTRKLTVTERRPGEVTR